MATIGKFNTLRVIRNAPPGIYLDAGEHGEILLPRRYIPRDILLGGTLDVFVYRDSEDRLVATTETPLGTVGDFVALKVVGLNRQIGAFLDWGLAKDLLLPFREQTFPLRVGHKVLVFIYLDPTSNRIVATMRLDRHLSRATPLYRAGDVVQVLIANRCPLGYNALIERQHLGLIFANGQSTALEIGQSLKAFVKAVHPNGKIDLSLDASGYKRVASLSNNILDALESHGGRLLLDDDSPPEIIRSQFGVSKKAFKQALGSLYKTRQIRFLKPAIELLDNEPWSPGD